jgi:hypothetical protein
MFFVYEMKVHRPNEVFRMVNRRTTKYPDGRPLDLEEAKALARIGAEKGKHDRVVTSSPRSRKFKILARYKAKTGEKMPLPNGRYIEAEAPPASPPADPPGDG